MVGKTGSFQYDLISLVDWKDSALIITALDEAILALVAPLLI